MNYIDGFINILKIFGVYYLLGLSFIGLLPKKKITKYFPLVLILGYSIGFLAAPLSYRGLSPNEIILTFLGFILAGIIYSILTNRIVVIFKNILNPRNLVLLCLFSVSAGILLYLPTRHTDNMAPFSHGNNDPWFFVSRGWFYSSRSFQEIPTDLVKSKPAMSGPVLKGFFPITAFQLGLISNLLKINSFWLFNSFRAFLQATSLFGIFFIFKNFFRLSFWISLLGGVLFIFHPYNLYIYYQGFLKQLFGYSGFLVYPFIVGHIIKNKTLALILPLFGFLIYGHYYKPVLVLLILFGLIFLFTNIINSSFKTNQLKLLKLFKKYAKYFIAGLPVIMACLYLFFKKICLFR